MKTAILMVALVTTVLCLPETLEKKYERKHQLKENFRSLTIDKKKANSFLERRDLPLWVERIREMLRPNDMQLQQNKEPLQSKQLSDEAYKKNKTKRQTMS
ncbi:Hypothetical predicted protein [Mytilus galloprovincialis]|uniref:Uncharacterized protein n=1 Tax=Mytilus galloprovincialis TaxID=29158 RepID=A0A8B6H798_MYTGA|nr:Hypothetical predicted protein [Mytilus galloprovincialis]